jgi:hypothetical protein
MTPHVTPAVAYATRADRTIDVVLLKLSDAACTRVCDPRRRLGKHVRAKVRTRYRLCQPVDLCNKALRRLAIASMPHFGRPQTSADANLAGGHRAASRSADPLLSHDRCVYLERVLRVVRYRKKLATYTHGSPCACTAAALR